MAHRNAEIYRQLYDMFLKQDIAGAKELVADDVRWHEAGAPDAVVGKDAVLQRLSLGESLTADVDVHDILADDDHVVALITAHMRKPNGDDITYRAVEVAHMRDGKVTERWSFMDAVPDDVGRFFADLG